MTGLDIGFEAEEYLSSLRRKGRKEGTVICYRNALRQCFEYLLEDGRSTRAEDITADDVHYLWSVLDVKQEVKHAYLRVVAGLTIFYTGRDVVKQADILRNREVRDRVFIDAEQFAILAANADPLQRIVMILGGLMGLRRTEIINLMDGDILDDSIVIHGKGHGDQGLVVRAPMPPCVREEIEAYREWKEGIMESCGDGYLVQTRSRKGQWSKATPQQISACISGLGKKCGIRVTTHSLRRFFATTLFYDVSADLQTVRNLMRHANASTTLKCYIEASVTKEKAAIDQVSRILGPMLPPLERRKG